jgi:hypothetical protein|tara:strand:- start:2372 stop:2584 length:213 start_codon:yes stop_codon:yes gene_type:complete
MNSYLIQSLGGLSMGMWKGESPQEALLKFYRKRGYTKEAVWIEDGELAFADDVLDIFGSTPNTWLVERVN